MKIKQCIFLFIISFLSAQVHAQNQIPPPHLVPHDGAVQLIVQSKPFLILGGELGDSTASDPAYLKPFSKNFSSLHMNTVLSPVY
jgi:hypothetical protein